MLKNTLAATMAAAVIAGAGLAGTTTVAEAGHKVKIKIHHHHGFKKHVWHNPYHHPYQHCFWKAKPKYKPWGVVWVQKRVCHWY